MATGIAIAALIISLASFGFGVFQYRTLHQLRIHEKVTSLLRAAHDLRRRAHVLKHTIDVTDNLDDCAELFALVETFVEVQVPAFVNSKRHTMSDLFKFEQSLLDLDTEIDVFQKQVEAVGKFNEEVREYEARKRVASEL